MPGKGKFSGFNWHHEFHTVDPQKEKPADCIFLTKDRICHNRNCLMNGEKCFVATHCRYRIKAEGAPKPAPAGRAWQCSLPMHCTVFSKTQGVGEYIACDKANRLITVKFDSCTKYYKYPDVFINHQLYGNQEVSDCVLADTQE